MITIFHMRSEMCTYINYIVYLHALYPTPISSLPFPILYLPLILR